MHYYPGAEEEHVPRASTSQAIDSSNKGFQLLAKMGWKGQGLGRNEDGERHPAAACARCSIPPNETASPPAAWLTRRKGGI